MKHEKMFPPYVLEFDAQNSCLHHRKATKMISSLQIELPKSLVEIVEERLREAIINGELRLGQALVEERLRILFGVSRTPLREALKRLEGQGLVVSVPKKGCFVFVPTEADVEDLCNFRLMLEINAIKLCVARNKDALLSELNAILSAMASSLSKDERLSYASQDTLFHEEFFKHSGSKYLKDAYRMVSARVSVIRTYLSVPLAKEVKCSLGEHRALVKAISGDDIEEVESILATHISRAYTTYLRTMDVKGYVGGEQAGLICSSPSAKAAKVLRVQNC
jgi:DNA-binding GntR family transcriptional regulator